MYYGLFLDCSRISSLIVLVIYCPLGQLIILTIQGIVLTSRCTVHSHNTGGSVDFYLPRGISSHSEYTPSKPTINTINRHIRTAALLVKSKKHLTTETMHYKWDNTNFNFSNDESSKSHSSSTWIPSTPKNIKLSEQKQTKKKNMGEYKKCFGDQP